MHLFYTLYVIVTRKAQCQALQTSILNLTIKAASSWNNYTTWYLYPCLRIQLFVANLITSFWPNSFKAECIIGRIKEVSISLNWSVMRYENASVKLNSPIRSLLKKLGCYVPKPWSSNNITTILLDMSWKLREIKLKGKKKSRLWLLIISFPFILVNDSIWQIPEDFAFPLESHYIYIARRL